MSYNDDDLIAQYKEHEKKVRRVFNKFDLDNSGKIDCDELLAVMDDLGLLANLKTDRVTFVAKELAEHDQDGNDMLDFEEFKLFYNAAKDDAAGRKVVRSKTSNSLDDKTKADRKKAAEERARAKAEVAEKILNENREMKKKIKVEGKDKKGLDDSVEERRKQLAAERKRIKQEEQARIKEENRKAKEKRLGVKSKTDANLLDDIAEDGTSIKEQRKQKAAASEEARQAEAARAAQSAKDLKEMAKNTQARTDDDLLDDVVDGESIAERRKQLKSAGEEAREAEAARAAQSAKDLKEMAKNTAARTDDDLLDDVVDGESVAEKRKELDAAGKAARKEEAARAVQSAKDLDAMAKNAQSRTDDDLLDDVVDGESVAERRKQLKSQGEEARQAEAVRAAQSAKDLKDMAKNAESRTDHDLLDDVVDGESVAERRKQLKSAGEEKRQVEAERAAQSAAELAELRAASGNPH